MALAEELHLCRSKSTDLVESIIGSIVSIDDAVHILKYFLGSPILSVHDSNGNELDAPKVQAACETAATQTVNPTTGSSSDNDSYKWKWGIPVEASEKFTALFLNVVAIAAHVAAIRSGKAKTHPLPSLRFVTLPDPHQPIPLCNDEAAQDCLPDVVALDAAAFCQASTSPNLFLLKDVSPFSYIRQHFPTLLDFTHAERSAHSTAVTQFEQWFSEQERCIYLDLSRFCWPEVQLTVEAKTSDIYKGVLQQMVYMQQQRCSQPWMRSIVGLVITTTTMGILRADTLGVEQCSFERNSSRGVLDTIRICLGLVHVTSLQLGQHEAFQLADTKTLAPPHLKTTTTEDVFVPQRPEVEYHHRTMRFIRLRGDRLHYPKDSSNPDLATFYVHHLIQDHGSLAGRCTRIFCVSRETESDGVVRRFVGPFALKFYYADHASDCFKDDLINVARRAQVENVLLPTWEWYYGDALSMRGEATLMPNIVSNCEEVFAQSDLKRVLAQCEDYTEFEQAFVDFIKGIASLADQDLVHQDLSIGNVLLNKDTPCPAAFLLDAEASAQELLGDSVSFTQRPLEQRVGGLIHDMDMAGRLYPSQPEQPLPTNSRDLLAILLLSPVLSEPARKKNRMGTLPFMAIQLLQDAGPHRVVYDLHSLVFIMILFFWSYPTFLDDPFPELVRAKTKSWPPEVLRWANRPAGLNLRELGALK
ncbi:hypothetical protein C8F01DRAFT_1105197, partial [Mycena amicta]